MSLRSRTEATFNYLRGPLANTGISRGTAAVQTVAAIAVAGGAVLAISDAADLYNNRQAQADQFQSQLQFPQDLIQSNRSFYMSFSFMKYEKRSIQNSPFLRSQGTVRLPLPEGLRDNLSVGYTPASLGPAVGATLESAAALREGSIGRTQALEGVAEGIGIGVTQNLVNQNTGVQTAFQAVQAYLGMAVNPYQTILFEKPEFKTHNFSWKIMPKTPEESEIVRNIYRTFQYHASPGISSGPGLFFSYPSMSIISLHPSSEFLYRFKPCVIKSVSVNYTGAGAPSFFKGTNAPTAMTLSLQLQEIEYWTANDYTPNSFVDTEASLNALRFNQNLRNRGS